MNIVARLALIGGMLGGLAVGCTSDPPAMANDAGTDAYTAPPSDTGVGGDSGAVDSGAVDSGGGAVDSGGGAVDSGGAGPGPDCRMMNWSNIPTACWECICRESTVGGVSPLARCPAGVCMTAVECALGIQPASPDGNHCLASNIANISCETSCVVGACGLTGQQALELVGGPGTPIFDLDLNLIMSPNKPMGQIRACQTECGIVDRDTQLCMDWPPA